MSVLIAYKRGDTVYMGTDTRVIANDCKRNELCQSSYKIQKLENGMIVGITADRLVRQAVFANSDIFTLDKKGELTRKHIVKDIIPKLSAMLNEEELMVNKEGSLPYFKAEIFLAHNGNLYEICSNFCVYRYEEYQTVGAVSDYAEFLLQSIKDTDDVEQKFVEALDIVAEHSQYVGRPYVLINTKDKEFKIIGTDYNGDEDKIQIKGDK